MGNRSAPRRALFALLICCTAWPVTVNAEQPPADLEAVEAAFVALARKVSPSVVAIETIDPMGRSGIPSPYGRGTLPMVGSGVIIDERGLILTNEHVVRHPGELVVILRGGLRVAAEVLAKDPRSDLAVVKIEAEDLVAAELVDVAEVQVGQWSLAMGNPYHLGRDGELALSYGIVSALNKSLPGLEEGGEKFYGNLIQTTAEINPGNSGGPLFNIQGQVIGINTAIETSTEAGERIGFAISFSSRTRRIIATLLEGRQVHYGFLGVSIAKADHDDLARADFIETAGVVVLGVAQGSPADEADIRKDDIILEYATTPVENPDDLVRLVGATPVGESVPLILRRNSEQISIDVTIAGRQRHSADR